MKIKKGQKKALKQEAKTIAFAFASVAAIKNIKKNEKFSIKNLTSKRPMIGIPAYKIFQIIGKRAKKNFLIGETIKLK